jgi:putative transposase
VVKPAARRAVVRFLIETYQLSERRSCRIARVSRSSHRYVHRREQQEWLRQRLRELAEQFPRHGYWRLYRKLRRAGIAVNHKRVHRLYREEGLLVRKRPHKRVARPRAELPPATQPNQRWSADFMSDATADGRGVRIGNVVDDCTREADSLVDRSIPAVRMIEFLDTFAEERGGYPASITIDHGPEFTSDAFDQWAAGHGIKLNFIEPGRPVQNCYIESFNGRMRDECLNQNWFTTLDNARHTIENWIREYNEEREHGSLGGLTPSEFARQWSRSELPPRADTPSSVLPLKGEEGRPQKTTTQRD